MKVPEKMEVPFLWLPRLDQRVPPGQRGTEKGTGVREGELQERIVP